MNPAFVYILKDKNGKFYIGSTSDILRRMKQHQYGHTQTTRRMNEPKLVFSQEYSTLIQARKVERRIKKLKRKDYIERIIKDGYIRVVV
jgi:putative endonuclease